jgi:hypothetical protein
MSIDINSISFLSIVVATISVVGICVYGAVRCIVARRFLATCGILFLIPVWLVVQFLVFVTFDKFVYLGIATRENHLEYALTPVLNLAGAGLVWYFVAKQSRDVMRASQADTQFGVWSWLSEPRKMVGLMFIIIGAAAMSLSFIVAGVLFVIVGVSLVMDVRIWRS